MRAAVGAAAIVALVAVSLALPGRWAAPDVAEATHGKMCGVIAKGSRDYLVLAKRIGCKRGRKGARRYLKRGKPLRGFRCTRDAGKYAFVCKHRARPAKSYRAERL